MHTLRLAAIFSLVIVATPVLADSIDDAEAKRRGVPVAQVQAENALAKERQRTADLEKQLAELQKELADFKSQNATMSSGPPATVSTASAAPTAPINFDGPRETSPLYDDLVQRYLAGDWTTLAADVAAKDIEIAKLPAGNRADLTYIKQTVAECRPAWWAQAKTGKDTQFKQTLWGHTVGIEFKSADEPQLGRVSQANGALVTVASWPADDMDSKDPITMMYLGIGSSAPCNFVRADGVNYVIWTMLGGAQVLQANADKLGKMTPAEREQVEAFAEFRSNLTAAYYGTPPGRRLALIQSATSMHKDAPHAAELFAHRPLAAAFLIELRLHPDRYKSLNLTSDDFGWTPTNENAEFNAADRIINKNLLSTRPTLTEDHFLRDMVKALADANQDATSSHIQLPNKLSMEFEPEKDQPSRVERMKFISTDTNPMKKN